MCLFTQLSEIMTALVPNSIRLGFQKNAFKSQRDLLFSHMGSFTLQYTLYGNVGAIRKAILNDSICLPLQAQTLCIVFEFSLILCSVSLYGAQQMVSNNGCCVAYVSTPLDQPLFIWVSGPAVNIHNHAAQMKIGDKSLHQPTCSH